MAAMDINADIGEGCGEDAALLTVISSCSIACGGHAGDADSIATTMREAIANGTADAITFINAHGTGTQGNDLADGIWTIGSLEIGRASCRERV